MVHDPAQRTEFRSGHIRANPRRRPKTALKGRERYPATSSEFQGTHVTGGEVVHSPRSWRRSSWIQVSSAGFRNRRTWNPPVFSSTIHSIREVDLLQERYVGSWHLADMVASRYDVRLSKKNRHPATHYVYAFLC